MSPALLFCILIAYFALLLGVAWVTSRNANNDSFFIGNKSSNWMLVAFGMVGTTLSGATFISVPGAVGIDAFGYQLLQRFEGAAAGMLGRPRPMLGQGIDDPDHGGVRQSPQDARVIGPHHARADHADSHLPLISP